MQWLLYAFVILAGVLDTFQTATNPALVEKAGQPIVAALLISLVTFVCAAIAAPFLGVSTASVTKATEAPWWSYLGGAFALVYTLATLYAGAKIGSAAFTGLAVTAAIVTSVVLDHFGLMGLDTRPAGIHRIAGCSLMIGGVLLVAKF